ncbi:MAG: Nif3-like dinuclear metal center hexameric protein [Syntrophobacteraceae bacterium]|nr:Nif3-like dinuclear metal center hexameric protein [Syntrophobacteraceae bacterium]
MTVRVKDLLAWIDSFAPFRYAESWDRCGLQVGHPGMTVQRVLVALDPNSASFSEAEERECQCLVTHHPLIFQPLTHIRLDQHPGNLLAGAIRRGIALVVAHTNLDVSRHGTNHHLARLLELQQTVPMEVNPMWREELEYLGMGQVGELPWVVCLREFVGTIREVLDAVKVRVVGNPGRRIRRIALCGGSGGSLVNLAVSLGVDCYVTGDIKYHEAQTAMEAGMALVDVGHFASERIVVPPLVRYLESQAEDRNLDLKVLEAVSDRDPFTTVGDDGNTLAG